MSTRTHAGESSSPTFEAARPQPHAAKAYWELDLSRATFALADLHDPARRSWDWAEELLSCIDVADVNQQTVHLLGFYPERESMIGRAIIEFWPADGVTALAEMILTCHSASSLAGPIKSPIASMTLRDPILTIWQVTDSPNRMCLAVEGITLDSRSLRDLRASEERYRRLLQHLPTALIQVDAREIGRVFAAMRARGVQDFEGFLNEHPELIERANATVQVTDANRSAAKLFGVQDVADLVGPVGYVFDACPGAARRVMIAHYKGLRSYAETMRVRTLDDRMIDVHLTVTYPAPPEELDVTLLSLEDITDRLQTAAQLRQLQADFTRAARILTLGELATSIAHEVSQPLAAILTNAETSLRWLAKGEANLAKVTQLNNRIATGARHASDVVQRIRGMAAKHSTERLVLDVNDVVQEVLLFIRHDLEIRSVKIDTAQGVGLPPVVGDRVQIQQIIVNLVLNSAQAVAQFGGRAGHIQLRTAAANNGGVIVEVQDDGPGIAVEHIDHIFDGFFTTKEDGMGVGLAICQSIATAHGGRITASNRAEGGARFELWLPTSDQKGA